MNPGPYTNDFRRVAAPNLVYSGVTESNAMMTTGHKSRSVFERYNISTDEDLKFAAELQAQNTRGVKKRCQIKKLIK